jgi:hypothetical protein
VPRLRRAGLLIGLLLGLAVLLPGSAGAHEPTSTLITLTAVGTPNRPGVHLTAQLPVEKLDLAYA